MNRLKKKITIGIILLATLYRTISLIFSEQEFEYKMLLVFGSLTFFFFVLTSSSCYYFRQFSSKRAEKICDLKKDCPACEPEGALEKLHRYFFWPALIIPLFHIFFAVKLGYISLTNPFFSIIAVLFGISYYLWLFSCRYFRHFFKEILAKSSPKTVFGKIFYRTHWQLEKIYLHHDTFFWFTLLFLALHLITVFLERI
ncbi:MAG: hypothetical protein HYW50_04785 [Candidatus Diapherotrites archaeon]|nr:hypothetical protein [Candidatus Diapherotrites archaeon]